MTHFHPEQVGVHAVERLMPNPERRQAATLGGHIRTALIGERSLCTAGIVATVALSRFTLVLHCERLQEFQAAAQHVQPSLCLYVSGVGQLPRSVGQVVELRQSGSAMRILTLSERAEDARVLTSAGADGHVSTDSSPEALLAALGALLESSSAWNRDWEPTTSATSLLPLQADQFNSLSAREIEVVAAIAQGRSNKCVARQLSIAEPTVKAHMRAILRKTGVANRTQLALWLSRRQQKPTLTRFARSASPLDPNRRVEG